LFRQRSLVFGILSQVGIVGDSLLNSLNKARSRGSRAVPQLIFKGNMTRGSHRKSRHLDSCID
jgi:hypothetical protein